MKREVGSIDSYEILTIGILPAAWKGIRPAVVEATMM